MTCVPPPYCQPGQPVAENLERRSLARHYLSEQLSTVEISLRFISSNYSASASARSLMFNLFS
jgi:hypothetical protein